MKKKEWTWLEQKEEEEVLKQLKARGYEDEVEIYEKKLKSQNQYDDYYTRKSKSDSMRIIVLAALIFCSLAICYAIFGYLS